MSVIVLRVLLVSYYVQSAIVTLSQSSLSYIGVFFAVLLKSVPVLIGFLFWQAILKRKKVIRPVLKKLSEEHKRQQNFFNWVSRLSSNKPFVAVIIGGSGFGLSKDEVVLVSCVSDNLTLSNIKTEKVFSIQFSKILNIEISGPGKVSTNAGVVGGGFGLRGALKGIMIASVINSLTTKTTINTFLRVSTAQGEVHLHTSELDTKELRLAISPAMVAVEAAQHISTFRGVSFDSVSNELKQLHQMHVDGVINQEEFSLAKERVLSKSS